MVQSLNRILWFRLCTISTTEAPICLQQVEISAPEAESVAGTVSGRERCADCVEREHVEGPDGSDRWGIKLQNGTLPLRSKDAQTGLRGN